MLEQTQLKLHKYLLHINKQNKLLSQQWSTTLLKNNNSNNININNNIVCFI